MKCPYCNNMVDVHLIKSLSAAEIQGMLDGIDHSRLKGIDSDFYKDMSVRLGKWGDKTKVTVPQRDWLKKLARLYPGKLPVPLPLPEPRDSSDEELF